MKIYSRLCLSTKQVCLLSPAKLYFTTFSPLAELYLDTFRGLHYNDISIIVSSTANCSFLQANQPKEAIMMCSKVLQFEESDIEALVNRAEAYILDDE